MTKAYTTRYERNARRAGWIPVQGRSGFYCCGASDETYRELAAESWQALCAQLGIGIGDRNKLIVAIFEMEGTP